LAFVDDVEAIKVENSLITAKLLHSCDWQMPLDDGTYDMAKLKKQFSTVAKYVKAEWRNYRKWNMQDQFTNITTTTNMRLKKRWRYSG
jgi:hypothetical protein